MVIDLVLNLPIKRHTLNIDRIQIHWSSQYIEDITEWSNSTELTRNMYAKYLIYKPKIILSFLQLVGY